MVIHKVKDCQTGFMISQDIEAKQQELYLKQIEQLLAYNQQLIAENQQLWQALSGA